MAINLKDKMGSIGSYNFFYNGAEYFVETWEFLDAQPAQWAYVYKLDKGIKVRIGDGINVTNRPHPEEYAMEQLVSQGKV